MTFHRTGFVLALSVSVGIIMITPAPTSAQDRGTQSQDQHQQGGQKSAGKGHQTQRPQQNQTQRSQQNHAQRPQQTQAQRPQQNHAQRPQQTQAQRPQQVQRPQQSHGNQAQYRASRQPNRGPQGRPNYQFRSQDTGRLRQYYQGGFGRIDRRHRPHFGRGGYIPGQYRGYFQPVPYGLIGYLPAVPPGYAIGYYDGYVVVYDPVTYMILSVLNILQ